MFSQIKLKKFLLKSILIKTFCFQKNIFDNFTKKNKFSDFLNLKFNFFFLRKNPTRLKTLRNIPCTGPIYSNKEFVLPVLEIFFI
jgi:hypothetical protein